MNRINLNRLTKLFSKNDECSSNEKKNSTELNVLSSKNDNPGAQLHNANNFTEKTIFGCRDISKVFEIFDDPNVKEELEKSDAILLLKVQFEDNFENLRNSEIQQLSKKCKNKSIVIAFESKNQKKFSVYWKSKELHHFLTFVPYNDTPPITERIFYEFLVKFLTKSLEDGHLGLCNIALRSVEKGSSVQLHLIADHRGYNLLLLAAECGHNDILKILLDQRLETELHQQPHQQIKAQNLAWDANHHEVVLTLIKASATYPDSFKIDECSNDLRQFCEKSEELHAAVVAGETAKISEILDHSQKPHPFYNRSNESAAKIALDSKQIQIYQLLVSRKIFLGRYEILHDSWKNFSDYDREILRKIHLKYSIHMPQKHINDLTNNSSVSHDDSDARANLDLVKYAFGILDENPFIRIILMIVAASKKLKILFDFKSGFVDVVDPTAGSGMTGLFYTKGIIYVAARYLLGHSTEHETFGTLAHELCHYAMKLVYRNMAKPYKRKDRESRQKFAKILKSCQQNRGKEQIIDLVFTYTSHEQHAELIVRVPHLMALYHNQPEKMKEARDNFIDLFEYYEQKVIPDMERALPRIEKEIEKMENRVLINKIIAIGTIVLSIFVIIGGFFVTRSIFDKPIFNFTELSESEQQFVERAPVNYKNVNVQFLDLFPRNTTAYKELTSDHISKMLSSQTLNFSDPHFYYLNDLISHSWTNLTESLKQKILSANLTFQNETLKLEGFEENCTKAFNALTSQQIINILDRKQLEVDKMISNQTEFYVERIFWDENIFETYFALYRESKVDPIPENVFRKFYNDFVIQNITAYIQTISGIRGGVDFKFLFDTDFNKTFSLLLSFETFRDDFDEMLEKVVKSRIFILSSEAGTGKTTTFEQFAMRIKKKYPMRWVSYIDLKEFTKFYNDNKNLDDVVDLLNNIFELNQKSEFEKELFRDLFESGGVVLLWNGFDEISPKYSDLVLNILKIIYENTKNIQFVCTRPLYSNMLRQEFNILTNTLVPFDKKKQEEFLRKSFMAKNINETDIQDYTDKVYKIVNTLKSKVLNENPPEDLNTPLILEMIADLISNSSENFVSENIYEIYLKFIRKKIKIWHDKSPLAEKILGDIATEREFDMMRMYQMYALKSEMPKIEEIIHFNSKRFKIFHVYIPEDLNPEEISRMGILYINGIKNFKFAHKTFAEFFVAQFFIENIYFGKHIDEDIEFIVKSFFDINLKYETSQTMITNFISSFLQTNRTVQNGSFNAKIENVIRTKFLRIFFDLLKTKNIKNFSLLFKFFKRDYKLLVDMLQVDENETLYTASFNNVYFPVYEDIPEIWLNRSELKMLGKNNLNKGDFKKFTQGRSQKGIIMFSLYLFNKQFPSKKRKSSVSHEEYKISNKIARNNNLFIIFNYVASKLNESELKELLLSASSPITYLDHKYSHQVNNFVQTENFWRIIERNLTSQEEKIFISNLLVGISKSDSIKNARKFLIPKTIEKLNRSEILQIFYDREILQQAAARNWENFAQFWSLFVNITDVSEQRKMLEREVNGNCFNPFYNSPSQNCHELPPMNILTFALNLDDLQKFTNIYEEYFSTSEIQQIILKSNQILPYLIMSYNGLACDEFAEYMGKIFKENGTLLEEYLMQVIHPFNMTLFEVLEDVGTVRAPSIAKNLKKFSDLLPIRNKTATQILDLRTSVSTEQTLFD